VKQRNHNYSDKLKDPRWQKLRLEVFQRDEFACVICGDDENTLSVHHLVYEKGKEPWEYPIKSLVTLCQVCHSAESFESKWTERMLIGVLKHCRFFSQQFNDLAEAFAFMPMVHTPEVIASVLNWALMDETIMRELTDRYFEMLMEKRKKRMKQNGMEPVEVKP
jgi:hypothetical protein